MKTIKTLTGGLAGAIALTLIHETMRQVQKDAPRMDLLGEQTLQKGMDAANMEVPGKKRIYGWTLMGDILGNALFYSLIGIGSRKHFLAKGSVLGLGAGIGGVLLPKYLGLNNDYSARTNKTKAMTVAWYLIGGIVAAGALKMLDDNKKSGQ